MNKLSSRRFRVPVHLAVLAVLITASVSVSAQIITLDRPPEGQFIVDKAGLIGPDDSDHIRKICQQLLDEKQVPLIVVTINAMRDHGAQDLRIETFATLLFDQWGIGSQDENLGILLLVSKQDHLSRIALGGDWDRNTDRAAQRIMNEDIVPQFKAGRFSQGIRAGVDALDALVRPREAAPGAAAPATAVPGTTAPARPVPPRLPSRQVSYQAPHPPHPTPYASSRTTHSSLGSALGGAGVFFIVIVVGILSLLKRLLGFGGSGYWGGGYRSSGWGDPFTGQHHHNHFGGGLFGGGMGSRGGSSFGSHSSGHSGGHSSGSFGGGSTRGGGATGSW